MPKVIEGIVYDEINTFLIENNILYNYESVFTYSHSKVFAYWAITKVEKSVGWTFDINFATVKEPLNPKT